MRKQVFLSAAAVICYIAFILYVAPGVRIPLIYHSFFPALLNPTADNQLPMTEQLEVVVNRSLWSFLKVEWGIESWAVHAVFTIFLFALNLSWFYFTGNRTKPR